MRTLFINLFVSIVFVSFAAGQDLKFSEWDTNNDNIIDRTEFEVNFKEKYTSPGEEINDESYLDKDGYYEFIYSVYDENEDQLLNPDEWNYMHVHVFDDYLLNEDFSIYDLNEDNYIGYDEFNIVANDVELFSHTDKDRNYYVSVSELGNNVFDNWNVDGDRGLTEVEFNAFDRHFFN